ncbi:hypothetical protein [Variovorax paradoxus]|uniref:hypothetical protein n=1 Tax=Variovorax paradoxus TaxID=34073 RepID=UPI0002ECC58C|nr:hypothetical protein [Variovorax paradoxus]
MPNADPEDEIAALARQAGELAAGEPLRSTLLAFAELLVARCARIGDRYGDWDENAGDHIRAVMYGIPDLPSKIPTDRESP